MKEPSSNNSICQKVLEKIKSGKVQMHSRLYFVLKAVFLVLGTVLVFGLAIFLASFILFILRLNGLHFLAGFGMPGLGIFFGAFPWVLAGLTLIFVLVLEIFSERFCFVYRRPLLYSVAGIVIVVLAGGYLIARTEMHSRLWERAEMENLPFAGPMYRLYGDIGTPQFVLGKVVDASGNRFEIQTKRGQLLQVLLPETASPAFDRDLEKGDMVIVIGQRQGGSITAEGFKKLRNPEDLEFYRYHLQMMRPSPPR